MWNTPADAGTFDPWSPAQRSCYFDRIIPPHKMTEINKWYAAGIISHRTAESQREGGQTHNETESSHLTTSLIFILFMQGVGYLRSKFLSGCSGLDSTPVLCNFKVQLEICTIGRGGGHTCPNNFQNGVIFWLRPLIFIYFTPILKSSPPLL